MKRVAILVGGKGSNARAVFQKARCGEIKNAEFAVLISDKPDAPALGVAKEFGVKALYLDTGAKGARFSEDGIALYLRTLAEMKIDLVVLAGFMKILPPEFVAAYAGRMINLHPSLLPDFKGKDAIKQAFEAGVKVCGCSVHFVSDDLDGGGIIAQSKVDVSPSDTLESLSEKVHAAEHGLLPKVVAELCADPALDIREYAGNNLSCFKTFNRAENYAEIKSEREAADAFDYARKTGLRPFVLGAGSNVFFKNTNIDAFVIKNALPKKIGHLGGDRYFVSSSVRMIEMLRRIYKDGRDCCYYLASAPCEVGGALAMNAGTGPKEKKSIFDFVESVRYFRDGRVFDKPAAEIDHSYRSSELASNAFVISAIFKFPERKFDADPVKARLDWARENQDLSVPNCGSLCTRYDARLMKFARLLFRPFPAGMSRKKLNWAYNKADNPAYLRAFLFTLGLLHKIFRKELKFELKIID